MSRPKNSVAYIVIKCNRKGYEKTDCCEKFLSIRTIVGCLILINEYHNFPLRFPGQIDAQPIQTVCPLFLSGVIIMDGFEIFPFIWSKKILKILMPLLIETRNYLPKAQKDFLPRIANYILLHVSGLPEQFGRRERTFMSKNRTAYFPMCFRHRSSFFAIYNPWKS